MNTLHTELPAIWQADNQQAIFRRLLHAQSYPGRSFELSQWLGGATAVSAVAATLVDHHVSFANPSALLSDADTRFLDSHEVAVDAADFIFIDGMQAPPEPFPCKLGTINSPELSATLVVQVQGFTHSQWSGTGPGIKDQINIAIDGLHPAWISFRERCNIAIPMGIDCIFCSDDTVLALPRTTKLSSISPTHAQQGSAS